MIIKGIAFDLEGTCIDVEEAHWQGHLRAASEVGVKLMTIDEAIQKIPHFIGGPDEVVAVEIARLASEEVSSKFILERKRFYYDEALFTLSVRLRPGLLEILEWLRDNEFRLAVGSLTIAAQANYLIERSGLAKFIYSTNFVLREQVKNVKPDPEVWFKTAKRMGLESHEQLVFEDSPRGIIAAKLAGSIAIGMPTLNKQQAIVDLINAGAVRVFMDWREINFPALIKNLSR